MRTFFFILVIINLAVFAWYGVWLERSIANPADSKTSGLTVKSPAVAQKRDTPPSSGSCYDIGPLSGDAIHDEILSFLKSQAISPVTRSEDAEEISNYWVFVPPLPSASQAKILLSELRGAGVQDSYVLEAGANKNAVSLGLFRDVGAAQARVDQLSEMGFNVQMQPRKSNAQIVHLRLSQEDGAVFARISDEFALKYPESKYQLVSCE